VITENTCPVCESNEVSDVFEATNMPANIAILWSTKEEALNCSKGDIRLGFCQTCNLIWNRVFDPTKFEYSEAYDNSLHFSQVYEEYARSQATHLVNTYNLFEKNIVEVGCGKGDFLIMLCEIGKNTGFGFDTSYVPREIDSEVADRITFIKDFYSEKYANYQGDLICSRYVLEHIDTPMTFLEAVRQSTGKRENVTVYFEVPDVYLILEKMSVWDIIYEHCLYFSPGSLAYIFEKNGFRVNDVTETYGDQFVCIEASPVVDGKNNQLYDRSGDQAKISPMVEAFNKTYKRRLNTWSRQITLIRERKERPIIWGAGAKTVSFLNMLGIDKSIEYVVDINPNKHGKYIAGTGHKIISPEEIREYNPDCVLIMNPMYEEEIRREIDRLVGKVEISVVQ